MCQVLNRFPFLINYADLWVIDDLVRSRLTYERRKAKRETDVRTIVELRAEAARQARRAAFEAIDSAYSAHT